MAIPPRSDDGAKKVGDAASRDRCVAVVPARFGSTRLPGKVLRPIEGVPLVERVRRRVAQATAVDRVVVVTDDRRVADVVRRAGGEVRLTVGEFPSGTHRVASLLPDLDADYVLNVQCDQPHLDPEHLDEVVALLVAGAPIATLATPLDGDPADPHVVKVVWDGQGRALYFSRSAIPAGGPFHRHVGVYGFRRDVLARATEAPASDLEVSEDLEQLRWLSAGLSVHVGLVQGVAASLDTPAQLAALDGAGLSASSP